MSIARDDESDVRRLTLTPHGGDWSARLAAADLAALGPTPAGDLD